MTDLLPFYEIRRNGDDFVAVFLKLAESAGSKRLISVDSVVDDSLRVRANALPKQDDLD